MRWAIWARGTATPVKLPDWGPRATWVAPGWAAWERLGPARRVSPVEGWEVREIQGVWDRGRAPVRARGQVRLHPALGTREPLTLPVGEE